jgi:formylglycine-generating enzyme required for sulfatase activity
VPLEQIPPFLKSVTLLQTDGSVPAAVADAVYRIAQERRRKRTIAAAGSVAVAAMLAGGVAYLLWSQRAPAQERIGKDGAPAVLVPAGSFTMGDDDEAPQRKIHVSAFYLDRYEVTTERYAKFLQATGSTHPPLGWETLDLGHGSDLAVTGVDWRDADAYCRWAGKRLPTEAEWEKAARGTDARRYPWGDASPTLDHANYQNASPSAYDGGLAAVGTHPAGKSPYGVHDLAGNAAEWVADWYAESFPSNDVLDPKGPASGAARVIRGGGRFDPDERIKATRRWYANPDTQAEDIGFRCARDP